MSAKVSFIPTRQEAPPVNAVALEPEQRSAALMALGALLGYPRWGGLRAALGLPR